MVLAPFDERLLPELMGWFGDAPACRRWGGPHFRFPYDAGTFRADARLETLPTWALLDGADDFVAFGQYYPRLGRCHLARLVVAPRARGRGVGARLIEELCRRGVAEYGTARISLFVMADNVSALRLYRRLGFTEVEYPEPGPESGKMLYMVASYGSSDSPGRQ